MKKTWFFLLALVSCLSCALYFFACSSTDKYGKEETYYDLNSGNTYYFDGNGNCNYAGLECTYEIIDENYSIYYDKTDKTLIFKKVKDGVLIETFKDSNSFLDVSVRGGYISGRITIGSSFIQIDYDGTYQEFSDYILVGIGNYYFNDGVLVLEQTLEITSSGFVGTIAYQAAYVNEGTGKLSGVLLADPSYYKQWHFDDNNGDNNYNDGNDDNDVDMPTYTQHTLTYDLDYDGITITAQQVVKGETVNLITPERNGYNFLGWYYYGSKIDSGVWEYDCDVTLTARWEAINYTITYNTADGIMPEYYWDSFTILSDLPYTLPTPIKQGFNFLGWYETSDFSGEPITEIPKNSLKNYVLYAKYTDEQLLEFELSFDETYYSVVGYKDSPQYITIPKEINGLPVKEIAAKAFSECDSLISISLPDSVTSIGNYVFYSCNRLTSITIPDSVISIGNSAFYGCNSLESITIPDGVTSIGDTAFDGCSSLISITIPDSVTSIGDTAFYGCDSLENITIPDGVTSIGNYAFYGCSSLISIIIPDGVTSIGDYAFDDCDSVTSIIIPASVTSIGDQAFCCDSLTSVFYKGTADNWSDIIRGNSAFTYGEIYYFSAAEPIDDGNYWHYDTDKTTPVIW